MCAAPGLPEPQFHFINELKTWTEAESYCREKYSHLAVIRDDDEVRTLRDMVDLDTFTQDVSLVQM